MKFCLRRGDHFAGHALTYSDTGVKAFGDDVA